jgi:hypothetical protein
VLSLLPLPVQFVQLPALSDIAIQPQPNKKASDRRDFAASPEGPEWEGPSGHLLVQVLTDDQ